VQIVEDLLRTWAGSQSSTVDGEDVNMEAEQTPEQQLDELRRCVDAFKPRIESNPWVQSLLTAL
jgi:DNA mismatch repair protein MSH2